MRTGYLLLISWACFTIMFSGTSWAVSEQQYAYEVCAKRYEKFRERGSFKAMVAGQDDKRMGCFSTYDSPDQETATERALANCRRNYPRCFVFATSKGLREWAAKISAMGGNDGSRRRSSSDDDDDGETAAAIVQGLIGAAGAIAGSGGGSAGGSSSGRSRPSAPCRSTSGASCGQR
jgi:hypothetical protein